MTSTTNIPEYLKTAFFFILFSWISFFPQPIQDKYRLYTQIFLGIFLLLLILNKKYIKDLFSLQDWPLWAFLILLISGILSATDKNTALKTYFYLAGTFFLLFYIGKGIYRFDEDRSAVNTIICIFSCLVAFIGILELYFGKNILYENFIANPFYERYIRFNPRIMSTQLNPAVLGSYLLGCLPFNFYLLRNKLLYLRLLSLCCFLLSLAVIVLTFSRGSLLGLSALLLFYLWKMQKKRPFFLSLFSLVLLVSVCSNQKHINFNRFGFKRLISGSYDSVISEYRLNRINMTFKILRDHPFFGIGLNHFRLRFTEYCGKKDAEEIYEFKIPDNMYLTFLAETGLVGTSGFLIFIFLLLKRALRNLRELEDGAKKQMLLISISALIGLLVNAGAYELFYWSNPYMLFCFICGFVGSQKSAQARI